jgi:serine protease Do
MKPARIVFPAMLAFVLFLAQGLASVQAADLPNFVNIVKENTPAVVNISTTQNVKVPQFQGFPNLPENSPFNQYFKRFFENPQGQPREEQVHSLGSGFIISSDGYILTNYHVVKDAQQIVVQLHDNRELNAKVIGYDKPTDVALLLAIVAPFGLQYTATQGIVSALGRSLPNETYVPFIQTDVAVNPGNSGGPLIDLQGQVVGINSQIYSNTGGFMGLSFAIPINVVMNVADQLKAQGHVTRGWLGVYIQNVTQQLAESFGLKEPSGALVSKVLPDSPAAKAGLKPGDIIESYNGEKVMDSSQLPPMVAATEVGKTVPVTIIRDGKTRELEVTIEKLAIKSKQEAEQTRGKKHGEYRLNIAVSDLTQQQREELGVGNRGVLVEGVEPGPAADAGIRPGDVLLMVDHHDVKNVQQLIKIIEDLPPGKRVPVLVQRGDSTIFLALQAPPKKG